MMPLKTEHSWNAQLLASSPIYWPLLHSAQSFTNAHKKWPSLRDYQHYLNQGHGQLYSHAGAPLHFVPQDDKPQCIEDGYEPRIYLKGEIQTRLNNWHDFFQVLVWRLFPNTKTTLNKLHYHAIMQRYRQRQNEHPNHAAGQSQRSTRENALTQFDECGAILLASDVNLLQLVKNFEWKTLFSKHRAELASKFRCIVFGHAIYEKAIAPYIGLTAHSILFHVDESILQKPMPELANIVDGLANDYFEQPANSSTPQCFSPFPILGMPGWIPENSQPDFYENTHYFRPGRKKQSTQLHTS